MTRHKDSPLQIHNQCTKPSVILPLHPSLPWRSLRIVGRPNQKRVLLHEGVNLFLFPNVISGGEDVDAALEKLFCASYIHAHAFGCLLGISNDQGYPLALDQSWNEIPDSSTT